MYTTLLLSAGGLKGFAYMGIWKYLEEKDIKISTFAGVSIGAFFSMLFSLGFTFEEIYNILIDVNLLEIFEFDFVNFFQNYGMIDIENLEKMIITKIQEKGFNKDITFQQLYNITGRELQTYAVCVNTHTLECFDRENTPDCPIWLAVKMSISIPLIFPPIMYNDKYYVDGGVQNGFPIELYNLSETIPCLIKETPKKEIETIMDFIHNTYKSFKKFKCEGNACLIYPDIPTLDVSITREQIDSVIEMGYVSISSWMEGKSF